MSNAYKDYQHDLREIFNEKMHEVNMLYDGWQDSFVPKMMDEMFNALGFYVEDFEVYQIKEKFGSLEIYHGWKDREYTEEEFADINNITSDIYEIIRKYRDISLYTCVGCGDKATFLSDGWVIPWCDKCRDRKFGVYSIIEK